jgi:hypothetical protein
MTTQEYLLSAIVVLLIYVIYKLHRMSSERLTPYESGYVGSGVGNMPVFYTSGATMRQLGTSFSQPSQGFQVSIHNADLPPSQRPQNAMTVYMAPSGPYDPSRQMP